MLGRFEADDDGRARELPGPEFWVRDDCGLVVLGPGLAAPRGPLNVPIKGDGAKTGDAALEALALKKSQLDAEVTAMK